MFGIWIRIPNRPFGYESSTAVPDQNIHETNNVRIVGDELNLIKAVKSVPRSSVADPDPDPVGSGLFGSPGSGSGFGKKIYGSGSGSGSFIHNNI